MLWTWSLLSNTFIQKYVRQYFSKTQVWFHGCRSYFVYIIKYSWIVRFNWPNACVYTKQCRRWCFLDPLQKPCKKRPLIIIPYNIMHYYALSKNRYILFILRFYKSLRRLQVYPLSIFMRFWIHISLFTKESIIDKNIWYFLKIFTITVSVLS